MMYYMISWAQIEQGFASIGQAFGDVLSFLRQIVEGTLDFLKWMPYLATFTQSMIRYIIPEFAIISVVVIAVYIIKIIVGGDNK